MNLSRKVIIVGRSNVVLLMNKDVSVLKTFVSLTIITFLLIINVVMSIYSIIMNLVYILEVLGIFRVKMVLPPS